MFSRLTRIEREFKRIAQSIRPFELQKLDDEPPLEDQDLFGELFGRAQASRFLGYYSKRGFERVFEAYGIFAKLRDRGFFDPQVEFDLSDLTRHRLRIYDGPGRETDSLLLDFAAHLGCGGELTASRTYSHLPSLPSPIDLLVVDWLMLQNPRASFRADELLPGQTYPGLGLSLEIGTLIGRIAHRLKLDGCLVTPAWYHNALMYSQRYTFVEPIVEGRFRALRRDTVHLSRLEVSWAVELGCIRTIDEGSPVGGDLEEPAWRWEGRGQLWALTPRLEAYFKRPAFRGVRDAICDGTHYQVDLDRLREARARQESLGPEASVGQPGTLRIDVERSGQ